MSRKGI